MNAFLKLLAIPAILTTSVAVAEEITTVDCANAKVTINEMMTMAIKEETGEEKFGSDVCGIVEQIDASKYVEPTLVNVQLSSGKEYDVTLQAKQ